MVSAQPLEKLDISKEALTALTRTMQSVIEGSDSVVLTPLGENNDPESLLSDVQSMLDGSSDITDRLMEMELQNASKFGPRSIAKPWSERKKDTLKYFDSHDYIDESNIVAQPGYASRLRPINFDKAVDKLWNSTSAGLPQLKRKGLVKQDYSEGKWREELSQRLPCVLYTRTQEERKTRDVWGYPMCETVREMRFFAPLLEQRKQLFERAALLGPDAVDIAVTQIFEAAKGKKLVSIDFSGYDRTIGSKLQERAYSVIASYFQRDYIDEIREIAKVFNSIGLATPDGVLNGPHGVPSGSTFTNEVDSIAQVEAASDFKDKYVQTYYQVQGDDGVYVSEDPEGLFEGFQAHGLSVNSDKSDISVDYAIYLQRYYDKYYKTDIIHGIYPIVRALLRLVYMERWTDLKKLGVSGKDFFSIRAISILENCKHHPLFREFVKYIRDLDDTNLTFDSSSLKAYIEGLENKSGGLVNQYSDLVTGINQFETTKLLMTL
jgi:hypothetical protein